MRRHVISVKGSRLWQGIPAIELASNGRLWCAFFSGGPKEPDPDNYILLTTSSDDGVTWSDVAPVVDPPGLTRAYDPALWHDPTGRLWLFYNTANCDTHQFAVCCMTAESSYSSDLLWSPPRTIDLDVPFAFRLNKPTVLSTGEWLLPVTYSRRAPQGWFGGSEQLQGVAISADSGVSWTLHGAVESPEWALENMVVQRTDGSLLMLIRTGCGVLWKSESPDRGKTWSPGVPTNIVNPGSRFFIRRQSSGRLLLINTPDPEKRSSIFSFLSEMEDLTGFGTGLELDGRANVSYPDAVQSSSGPVYAVHDFDRQGRGEIMLNVFSEDEMV